MIKHLNKKKSCSCSCSSSCSSSNINSNINSNNNININPDTSYITDSFIIGLILVECSSHNSI